LNTITPLIINANGKDPYIVIEMKKNFKDFENCAKLFNYNLIPFKRIFELSLTQNLFGNNYRLSPDSNFITVNIRNYERSSEETNTQKEKYF